MKSSAPLYTDCRERLSGKCSSGVMVAYAARHGEQEIPHGSVRQRVALHRSTPSRAGRTGTPQAPRLTGDHERRLLRARERLPMMAAFAPRLPDLEDRLGLVQEVAHRRGAGAPQRWAARALTVAGREGSAPQRRHRRLPVCEDDGGGEQRGYYGGKKVRGRKRHLLVDTEGWFSRRRFTAPRSPTRTASGCCWSVRGIASLGSPTCGWTPATGVGARSGRSGLWA